MLCQFERLIYPQSVSTIDAGSFMIAVYRPCEKIKDSAGDLVTQVKAVGYGLPIADKQRYELQGHWSKNPKHGVQFEVETYDEVITPTRERFSSFKPTSQDQYKATIGNYILTLLPVWMQYRNTYINV